MQDFLLTLVVVFVLFRIFGRSASTKSSVHFTQNNFHASQQKKEGEIHVDYIPEQKPTKAVEKDRGDYIDYEEVK